VKADQCEVQMLLQEELIFRCGFDAPGSCQNGNKCKTYFTISTVLYCTVLYAQPAVQPGNGNLVCHLKRSPEEVN